MPELNTNASSVEDSLNEIESVVALFRNFSPNKPIGNAVLYFWESHTDNGNDREKMQATIDLIHKEFDMAACEKYEVRTGYLNRHNYLKKPIENCTIEEIEEAISKGKMLEQEWVAKCNPGLPGFITKDWKECISKERNSYFEECKYLVQQKLENDHDFSTAFLKSVHEYVLKHGTDVTNGKRYILEELSWMLSLPLLHLNKQIYLIYIGSSNSAITAMFHHFPHLQKAVKWLSPTFKTNVFENLADFLLAYRNGSHLGYSYAIENKASVKEITHFKREETLTKEELLYLLDIERSEKNFLRSIIGKLPGHVYWLNRNNVYLGCNDIQAKSFGLNSKNEIMGKTNYDFLPEKEASELNEINKEVLETGIPYEGEELASMKSKSGNYLSQKVPLHDDNGKIIGLLGMSIDITDRKRAEELELQNKVQKISIKEQEEFRSFTARVVHDIASPLLALESLVRSCHEMPEEKQKALRSVAASIRNISRALLDRHKKDQLEACAEQEQDILVPLALEEAITHKKYQYKETFVDFSYSYNPEDKFTFIKGDQSNFGRMISNLMNNAVEASEGRHGIVDVTFKVKENYVYITIQDNGKGMPQEMIDKIMSNSPVGTTKKEGHGIGLEQVMNTLKLYNGKIEVESEEGIGTKITLKLPMINPPKWVAQKIVLNKGDTVVVLDDDPSILSVWKDLLDAHSKDLSLRFFTTSQEVMEFIDSSYEKEKIFLLSDYELRNDDSTGLVTILQSGMKQRSLIVTSIHNDKHIHDLVDRSNLKMVPKQFLLDIPILIEG